MNARDAFVEGLRTGFFCGLGWHLGKVGRVLDRLIDGACLGAGVGLALKLLGIDITISGG